MIKVGDCKEVLKEIEDNYFDSCVTDPPYGLKFMGKSWDGLGKNAREQIQWHEEWAREVYRTLKPGAFILAFGGTRTYQYLAIALEEVGFEIRDSLHWLYGSGFPKSMDVSKQLDKSAGAKRDIVGIRQMPGFAKSNVDHGQQNRYTTEFSEVSAVPLTDLAKQWEGWGTALKPAFEPIVMARKPLIGTVAKNIQEYGTGAINIDACRIAIAEKDNIYKTNPHTKGGFGHANAGVYGDSDGAPTYDPSKGRWPANILLDEESAALLDAQTGKSVSKSGGLAGTIGYHGGGTGADRGGYDDSGGASRFFYVAKASRKEREAGLDAAEDKRANDHPTVKPIDLMRYLCRLVTPLGGIVLDPFLGSGTTGIAAEKEGFNIYGIELAEHYANIAEARMEHYR